MTTNNSLIILPIQVPTAAVKVMREKRKMAITTIRENEIIRQEIQAENAANTDTEEYIYPVDQYKPEDLYAEKAPIGALPQKRY